MNASNDSSVKRDQEPPHPRRRGRGGTPAQIAILLASAALLAAVFELKASLQMGAAGGDWQTSVRSEVKRAAALDEDVRFVYGSEAPAAFNVAEAQALRSSFDAAAEKATGATHTALLLEAAVQFDLAKAEAAGIDLADPDRYGTPNGGFDVPGRLADVRSTYPELVIIDPRIEDRHGLESSRRALLQTVALLPLAIAFLLGALARTFPKSRRLCFRGATVSLSIGAIYGIVVWIGVL
jgi:hypothetical protein